VGSTNDRATEDQFVRPTVEAIDAGDGFNAAAPIPLPMRTRTPQQRPTRLLPPASSRYPFSVDEPASRHWSDRIWIPAALASVIVFGAIGFSVHADWTAKRNVDREVTASLEMRTSALAAPNRPSIAPAVDDRSSAAAPAGQIDSSRVPATPPPPPARAAEDAYRFAAAAPEAAPLRAPLRTEPETRSVAAAPPIPETLAPALRQASMDRLVSPTMVDTPPPPLVAPAAEAVPAPVSSPRLAPSMPPTPIAAAVMTPSRPTQSPAVQSAGRTPPKVSRIAARSSAKRGERWTDPDAPPRTWHGALHRQLMRTAP
jgi:hypothetical protein